MRKLFIKNINGTVEEATLIKAFGITDINKRIVVLSKNELSSEGLPKVYISEVVEANQGIYDLVGISDENLWSRIKESMHQMKDVQNSNELQLFDYENTIIEVREKDNLNAICKALYVSSTTLDIISYCTLPNVQFANNAPVTNPINPEPVQSAGAELIQPVVPEQTIPSGPVMTETPVLGGTPGVVENVSAPVTPEQTIPSGPVMTETPVLGGTPEVVENVSVPAAPEQPVLTETPISPVVPEVKESIAEPTPVIPSVPSIDEVVPAPVQAPEPVVSSNINNEVSEVKPLQNSTPTIDSGSIWNSSMVDDINKEVYEYKPEQQPREVIQQPEVELQTPQEFDRVVPDSYVETNIKLESDRAKLNAEYKELIQNRNKAFSECLDNALSNIQGVAEDARKRIQDAVEEGKRKLQDVIQEENRKETEFLSSVNAKADELSRSIEQARQSKNGNNLSAIENAVNNQTSELEYFDGSMKYGK